MKDEDKKEKNNEDFEDLTFVESNEDGEELSGKDVVKRLREELKISRKEKDEYLTGWQRAKADYVNLQKELENSKINNSIVVKEKMMHNLMPVLDSFDMAFSHKESWEKVDPVWKKGIENIHQQFMQALHKSGIDKIEESDVPFDPNIHQSIRVIETNEEFKDHIVAEILQPGYKIGDFSNPLGHGRVIRPAKVSIYEYNSNL